MTMISKKSEQKVVKVADKLIVISFSIYHNVSFFFNPIDDVDLLLDREKKYAEEFIRMEKFRQKETIVSRLKWNVEK